jgi:hypothetical protein
VAVIQFVYEFKADEFYAAIKPIIPSMENGEFKPLLDLAIKSIGDKDSPWEMLDDLILGSSIEDIEDVADLSSPGSLLMKVLACYVEPLISSEGFEWRVIKLVLPEMGWSKENVSKLINGRSLCEILIPEKKYNPVPYFDRSAYESRRRPWCEGYAGWLSHIEVQQYDYLLKEVRSSYYSFIENPTSNVEEYFKDLRESRIDIMDNAYKYISGVYEIASMKDTPIILGVA